MCGVSGICAALRQYIPSPAAVHYLEMARYCDVGERFVKRRTETMDVVQKRRNAAYRLSLHHFSVQVEPNGAQMNDTGNFF